MGGPRLIVGPFFCEVLDFRLFKAYRVGVKCERDGISVLAAACGVETTRGGDVVGRDEARA